jgi:hypothetical protein
VCRNSHVLRPDPTPTTLRFIEERGVELLFDEFPTPTRSTAAPRRCTHRAHRAHRAARTGGGAAIVDALSAVLEGMAGGDLR